MHLLQLLNPQLLLGATRCEAVAVDRCDVRVNASHSASAASHPVPSLLLKPDLRARSAPTQDPGSIQNHAGVQNQASVQVPWTSEPSFVAQAQLRAGHCAVHGLAPHRYLIWAMPKAAGPPYTRGLISVGCCSGNG